MVVEFNDLSNSNLIVNEIYKGGKASGKGSEVLHKLFPGISNSGGFRIKQGENPKRDYFCILYADNKHKEWINVFESSTGKFTYYGDNKDVNIPIENVSKKGISLLKRVNDHFKKENRKSIPPIFVFVKGKVGWDIRFIGIAVPGFIEDQPTKFLEEVSYDEGEGQVANYKSIYTILDVRVISREWINDVMEGRAYESKHVPLNWKIWVDKGIYIPLINGAESFAEENRKMYQNNQLHFEDKIEVSQPFLLDRTYSYLTAKGFLYSKEYIANLYLSLRSKPFVIISGISGTGKTKIVQLFAESVGATEENGQFKLISVRPDWSDSSDLLGYKNLQDQFVEGQLTEIVKRAHQYPRLPHFVVLDEMNLARVEYYLSEFLSIMESRRVGEDGEVVSSTLVTTNDGDFSLPNNLYIIGTVNMDETTHPFSKKVLDRANTIEFNDIQLSNFAMFEQDEEEVAAVRLGNDQFESKYLYLKQAYPQNKELVQNISANLEKINEQLQTIYAQVGYRVRDEICFYMLYNDEMQLLSEEEAFDFCVMQKILPRISGTDSTVEDLLKNIYKQFTGEVYEKDKAVSKDATYPRSAKKVVEMLNRLYKDGFTSFWVS